MKSLRLGRIDYLNVFPIYHAIDTGKVALDVSFHKGVPAELNRLFVAGELDITPISSIEYARHQDECYILPDISVSADGPVQSVCLFCREPLESLAGATIAVTTHSATSVVLLEILLKEHFRIPVRLVPMEPNLEKMLTDHPAALLIGDGALAAAQTFQGAAIVDLGEAWKAFTDKPMIFALWVIRREIAELYPEKVAEVSRVFRQAKEWSLSHMDELIEAATHTGFSPEVLRSYFQVIRNDLREEYRSSLNLYYDYAYRHGLVDQPVKLRIWGEEV